MNDRNNELKWENDVFGDSNKQISYSEKLINSKKTGDRIDHINNIICLHIFLLFISHHNLSLF